MGSRGEDIPTAVRNLKERTGGVLLTHGCGSLTRTLLEHDLVDEAQCWVYPVVRGTGDGIFHGGLHADLELTATRQFQGGFSILT